MGLHHEKTSYFLKNIVTNVIIGELLNFKLEVSTYDFDYIGGALHIKKKSFNDYTTFQEEREARLKKEKQTQIASGINWKDLDFEEDDWSFDNLGSDLIRRDKEITEWRKNNGKL